MYNKAVAAMSDTSPSCLLHVLLGLVNILEKKKKKIIYIKFVSWELGPDPYGILGTDGDTNIREPMWRQDILTFK